MESKKVRKIFLDFFRDKGHLIVPSAPMVVKDDPTLMFNNSGMAPFKDLFLGNAPIINPRIADTQKCLRVSGKHNDLEEVGVDTYHHTMFEMLGNWSFGDYFKKEAIAWAWELLTEVYKLDKKDLYVTVFEGHAEEGLLFDEESQKTWKQFVDESHILRGNKKDNFWEMGDTGPCGPCSEVHVDLRSDSEKSKISGASLVNTGHPQVIEIWNLVFMEFERKASGELVKLPKQHVDTGMGFERLCMALQGKKSNYDTDIFQSLIQFISARTGKPYGKDEQTDIAMRVLSDHIRTISFAIADGQLPGNAKAGYVIRRILRRAVRYYYTFLDIQAPFLYMLTDILVKQMGEFFPELIQQQTLIEKVIREEETAFLKTLGTGIHRFEHYMENLQGKTIDGNFAFELFDTYGFPIDLTQLLAREHQVDVDMEVFRKCLDKQKERSRAAGNVETGDWTVLSSDAESVFIGYEQDKCQTKILKHRKVQAKGKEQIELVLRETPFYAESGGQVGDAGVLVFSDETVHVRDTRKENGMWIHLCDRMPKHPEQVCEAQIDAKRRRLIENNHTATHLMHAALRKILGTHVEQKGSLVNDEYLRFDFSHFEKVSANELNAIEEMVNEKIRENISRETEITGIEKARAKGAMALFGEKYGDLVRVVSFDAGYSIELCGGTHVHETGKIGHFKIITESAVAAGIRRIEAITSTRAAAYIKEQMEELNTIKQLLKNPKQTARAVEELLQKNTELQKQIEKFREKEAGVLFGKVRAEVKSQNGTDFVAAFVETDHADTLKDICFRLRAEFPGLYAVLGGNINGKASLHIMLGERLMEEKKLKASEIIKTLASSIKGGGGGQAHYASAGGTDTEGLKKLLLTYSFPQ
ncbi:MAG: alanine--tRNA ligase [Bacteroidota bacterium]|jgi:alanyl-tRNA synthetase